MQSATAAVYSWVPVHAGPDPVELAVLADVEAEVAPPVLALVLPPVLIVEAPPAVGSPAT